MFTPEYFAAVTEAVMNGAKVLVAMMILASILSLASGGTAALNWKKTEDSH